MTSNVRSVVDALAAELRLGNIAQPDQEALLILAHAVGATLGELRLQQVLGRAVADETNDRAMAIARQRRRRLPLQHLLGHAPFRELELAVGPGVFVPRPETELLVEHAIRLAGELPDAPTTRILDLGAGSGAITISLAHVWPHAAVIGFEASPQAWPWLRRNARELGSETAVRLRFGDWQEQTHDLDHADLIVSNPPYVPARALPQDPEVHAFDPAMALYSGIDGLQEIRRIALAAARLLRPGGWLVLEHTEEQGPAVGNILNNAGLIDAVTLPDLTGRDRFSAARQVSHSCAQ